MKKRKSNFMDNAVKNLSSDHLLNPESYDTDRNKIKGYKDVL